MQCEKLNVKDFSRCKPLLFWKNSSLKFDYFGSIHLLQPLASEINVNDFYDS